VKIHRPITLKYSAVTPTSNFGRPRVKNPVGARHLTPLHGGRTLPRRTAAASACARIEARWSLTDSAMTAGSHLPRRPTRRVTAHQGSVFPLCLKFYSSAACAANGISPSDEHPVRGRRSKSLASCWIQQLRLRWSRIASRLRIIDVFFRLARPEKIQGSSHFLPCVSPAHNALC
jgi:hypothetical protein